MDKGKIVVHKGFRTKLINYTFFNYKKALGQTALETKEAVVSVLRDISVVTCYQLCLIKAFPLKIFHFRVALFQKIYVSCKFMVGDCYYKKKYNSNEDKKQACTQMWQKTG